jgi:hypothetical protein
MQICSEPDVHSQNLRMVISYDKALANGRQTASDGPSHDDSRRHSLSSREETIAGRVQVQNGQACQGTKARPKVP